MRGIALLVAGDAGRAAPLQPAARADEIEVRDVALRSVDDGLALDADFAFELDAAACRGGGERRAALFPRRFRADAAAAGTGSTRRPLAKRLQLRLSYHALSRQYRLSTGLLQQSFPTLEEALDVLKRVRNWLVVDRRRALSDARLRSRAAHAARHDAAAQAVPA